MKCFEYVYNAYLLLLLNDAFLTSFMNWIRYFGFTVVEKSKTVDVQNILQCLCPMKLKLLKKHSHVLLSSHNKIISV